MKYLLDTNMCIYAQKGVPSVLDHLRNKWPEGIAISVMTLAEMKYGVEASANPEKNLAALMKFLAIVDILDFDGNAAMEYGKICAYLRSKGTPIGTMDMLIAAHGKSMGMTIVTNNTREFERIPSIKLENWYK